MRYKCPILVLLLLASHFTMAQRIAISEKLTEIDSLIKYSRFDIAQRETDSLYEVLNTFSKKHKYKTELLELRFRHALIIDRQDAAPDQTLSILQEIVDEATAAQLHSLSYRSYLLLALTYEKHGNLELTNDYLALAYKEYKNNGLDEIYSTYCVRRSSYFRVQKQYDSANYFAKQARQYALKYDNETDLTDSYILLGSIARRAYSNYDEAIKYLNLLLSYRIRFNDSTSIATTYNDIALNYFENVNYSKSLLYSDSAYIYYNSNISLIYKVSLPEQRYEIFKVLGNKDSTYYYFKQYHDDLLLLLKQEEFVKVKKIEAQYQNDKKEARIKSREQQLVFIIILLTVIVIASVLLVRNNRKINRQNNVISKQLVELTKTLEQKQVLLSELQHRVKNNLQHVISILEIQKESIDFNNIEELVRGNQNRIHSMALLHKKMNVSDNVSEVNLGRYVAELAELVCESYARPKKKVELNVVCSIDKISIEKALPIGLIVVELVSNSIKHAFKKRSVGLITIEIGNSDDLSKKKLYYADSGDGYDFNKVSDKGLGQEIIKGLIDQLDGTFETQSNNGFELTIYFQ